MSEAPPVSGAEATAPRDAEPMSGAPAPSSGAEQGVAPRARPSWVRGDGTMVDRAPAPDAITWAVTLFWGVLAFFSDFLSSAFSGPPSRSSATRGGVIKRPPPPARRDAPTQRPLAHVRGVGDIQPPAANCGAGGG